MRKNPSPLAALLMLFLGACAVGPDYKKPDVAIPAAYKEQQGPWRLAQPKTADNSAWWSVYSDPVLDTLLSQVSISNQNLKAAEAAYREAQALSGQARAGLFPTIGVDASAGRSKTGGGAANRYATSVSAVWEPDLWGNIRRSIESSEALAEASAANLAAARLSAQAELASDYFELRVQDEQKRLLEETVEGYQDSLKITQNQYKTGVVAKTDVMQAETQLKSAQSNLINLGIRRAQLEHAIAVLIGKPPAEFSIQPTKFLATIPEIPVEVPSALLERRPDIAAAERQMQADNAQIGVAIGAFFPDITLSGSYGFASAALSTLLKASNNIWSVGPALALTLFDGGARDAQVEAARARYDQSVATYRQTVLSSFQDVEDQLSATRILGQQAVAESETVKSAQEAEKLVRNQYKAGVAPYTSVVVAEATSLGNQQSALGIRRDRLLASVSLIRALGGSWNASMIPSEAKAAESAPRESGAVDASKNIAAPEKSFFERVF
jgi:NodT family efflux transporter outer membrane factor (OMF) lipoprotein